jgi:predicted metal-binding membrane protein
MCPRLINIGRNKPAEAELLMDSDASMEGGAAGSARAPAIVHDRLAVTISLSLLGAAGIAWVLAYHLAPQMMDPMMGTMGVASIVFSLSAGVVAFFEFSWIVGMIAMMFPAMIPVVLFYNRFVARGEGSSRAGRDLGTPLFLLGYLCVYAALEIAAYFGVYAALRIPAVAPSLAAFAVAAPGAVLIVAAAYQLSPLKTACLSKCVSPMGFFTLHNERGLSGALRMGVWHGAYCVGCCWAYMLVMLVVGLMSIPAMVTLAGLIALEKVIVRDQVWFTRFVAAGFAVAGVVGLAFPAVFASLPI